MKGASAHRAGCLISCHACRLIALVWNLDEDERERVLDVRTKGVFVGCQATAKYTTDQ